MPKKKFKATPFKLWLDQLAKICIKTRDNFTCQIQQEGCSGRMQPLDFNCQWCHIKSGRRNNLRWNFMNLLTGCGHCHCWGHDNTNEFGVWFAEKYPLRNEHINLPRYNRPWSEVDFRLVEKYLIQKCKDFNVDPLHVPQAYRKRFIKAIE